jgi:uncharacterized integral membrane protein
MSMRPLAEKRSKKTLAALIAAGVISGMFALLFAVANSDWVVVSIPSPPWEIKPFAAAFEARLWAIMLFCFFAGAVLAGLATIVVNIEHRKKAAQQGFRMKQLEGEIKNLNRLLEAAMIGQISEDQKKISSKTGGGTDER